MIGVSIGIPFSNSNGWPTPAQLGNLITNNFGSLGDLNNYTLSTPASTIALSGGYLRLTNSPGAGTFLNYARYDAYGSTQLQNYSLEMVVIPRNNIADSFGCGVGFIGTNTLVTNTVYNCLFYCGTGANNGKILLYRNTTNIGSSAALVWAVGDRIKVVITRSNFTYTATATNLGSGASVSVSTTINIAATSPVTNSICKPAIYSFGGTQDVESFNFSSTEYKNVSASFHGDSITEGYTASAIGNRWQSLFVAGSNKRFINNASQASSTADLLLCINEMKSLKPQYCFLAIGTNDIGNAVPAATYQANYLSIISQMASVGSTMILCTPIARDTFSMLPFVNFVNSLTNYARVDLFALTRNGLGTGLLPAYNDGNGDGTHPGNSGHAAIGALLRSRFPYVI